MDNPEKISLKIKNYKSFGDQPQGFDAIKPVNIIIGKNNSGKSALLDALGFAASKQDNIMGSLYNNGNAPEIIFESSITEQKVRNIFPPDVSGGSIAGSHYEYGKRWIDGTVTASMSFTSDRPSFISVKPDFESDATRNEFAHQLVRDLSRPFSQYVVRRLAADRDIKPEGAQNGGNLSPDGTGATNLIRFCLHDADANAGKFIRKDLLTALNDIFEGETTFTDILVKSRANMWEVYLAESTKGDEISISNSGSGLKTIILVLLQLLVMAPMTASHGDRFFIFMFEEIENNLHPGLLRNLLSFIREYAKQKGCLFFITTHSSITIDLFDKDPDAQLVHVKHDRKTTTVSPIKHFSDKKEVIDDLDVRSSDILQANAIVWVEGPSDRTYINHWISLYSNGLLREGEHYQSIFYGGKLLARLTANPKNTDEANILKVNTNAILVMDSDIILPDDKINATKARMKAEVENINGYVWTTDGKEIENYLPKELLETYYEKTSTVPFNAQTRIQDFLNELEDKLGDAFVQQKPFYAERFIELYTKDMLDADIKLSKRIKNVCDRILTWNGMSQSPKL